MKKTLVMLVLLGCNTGNPCPTPEYLEIVAETGDCGDLTEREVEAVLSSVTLTCGLEGRIEISLAESTETTEWELTRLEDSWSGVVEKLHQLDGPVVCQSTYVVRAK